MQGLLVKLFGICTRCRRMCFLQIVIYCYLCLQRFRQMVRYTDRYRRSLIHEFTSGRA